MTEDSAKVTPGFKRKPISKVPSLNGGRKVVAKKGTATADNTAATPPAINADFGAISTACKALR